VGLVIERLAHHFVGDVAVGEDVGDATSILTALSAFQDKRTAKDRATSHAIVPL
jgi:hypothetical protein